jgi:hypothetical protein
MKPDFSESIKREIARTLALAHINGNRDAPKLPAETLYFCPGDFGGIFDILGWDKGRCIEVEIKWTHRAALNDTPD